jgi:hypothetical protein
MPHGPVFYSTLAEIEPWTIRTTLSSTRRCTRPNREPRFEPDRLHVAVAGRKTCTIDLFMSP